MRIGVPTEVKSQELRVSLTPAGAKELTGRGHQVLVQSGAGQGSGFEDEAYVEQGATIVPDADAAWGEADLVVKVKEPIESEYHLLRNDLTLFTYLHLAASRPCTDALLQAGTTAIAYETVQLPDRSLPLLTPMSEVAGCLAPQVGASAMMSAHGGPGLLFGGVGGVAPARVVVIGGGVSGACAVTIATGMRAEVTVLDTNLNRLRQLDEMHHGRVRTLASNALEIEQAVADADLVIGSVLIPGARAPKLVTNQMVASMKPGSVLVDIAIDQGGCFEDSHPTTHAEPTFGVHDSIFYCVANMPGAVSHTSTKALTNATMPYVLRIADQGWREALRHDPALAKGLSTHAGQVTSEPVAKAHDLPFTSLDQVLQG